jgi:hypothetical protein
MINTTEIDDLARKQSGMAKRELASAMRALAPALCREFDALKNDEARRAFYEENKNSLAGVKGLISIFLQAGKKLSPRAQQELATTKERPAYISRWAFDSLSPTTRLRYISLGGRVKD